LSETEGLLQFEVHDDGVGFDASQSAREGHLGLRLVQETVSDAGGHLDVASSPGQGTHVIGTLPL